MDKFKEGEVVILNAVPDGAFLCMNSEFGNWPPPRHCHGCLAIIKSRYRQDRFYTVRCKEVYDFYDFEVHESQLLKA